MKIINGLFTAETQKEARKLINIRETEFQMINGLNRIDTRSWQELFMAKLTYDNLPNEQVNQTIYVFCSRMADGKADEK